MAHRNRWSTVLKNGGSFHSYVSLPEGSHNIIPQPLRTSPGEEALAAAAPAPASAASVASVARGHKGRCSVVNCCCITMCMYHL